MSQLITSRKSSTPSSGEEVPRKTGARSRRHDESSAQLEPDKQQVHTVKHGRELAKSGTRAAHVKPGPYATELIVGKRIAERVAPNNGRGPSLPGRRVKKIQRRTESQVDKRIRRASAGVVTRARLAQGVPWTAARAKKLGSGETPPIVKSGLSANNHVHRDHLLFISGEEMMAEAAYRKLTGI